MPGSIFYGIVSSGASSGVVKDFFEIQGSTTYRTVLREVRFGQHSDHGGSTETEILAVTIRRGSTSAAAGGSTASAIKRDARSSSATATLQLNSSEPSSGGTVIWSGTWNVLDTFVYRPDANERPVMGLGERLNVRVSAPADAQTWDGTIIWEEVGPS